MRGDYGTKYALLGQGVTKGDILIISPYYRAANFKERKPLFHTVTRYKIRINGVRFNKGKCKLNIFQIRD